jgi:hypothetical protein
MRPARRRGDARPVRRRDDVPAGPAAKLNGSIVRSKAALGGTLLVEAGPAVVTVHDRSKTDGFLLEGPGISKKTGVAYTGTATWAVALQPGKYTYGAVRSVKSRQSFTVSAP